VIRVRVEDVLVDTDRAFDAVAKLQTGAIEGKAAADDRCASTFDRGASLAADHLNALQDGILRSCGNGDALQADGAQIDVVRAARLCTVGSGGQVLLSETTRALVGSSLPEGVSVHALGERHLKDIDEPERVFELGIDGAAAPLSPTPAPAAAPVAAPADPPAPAEPPTPGSKPGKRPKSDFGDRLSRRIQEQVQRKIDERLERVFSEVDALADRVAERPETITEKLDDKEI